MSGPTAEQLGAMDSSARLRVVQAVPGSGKTWLVAQIIKREIAIRKDKICGIAALSFTRVGGEEIRKAVGYELSHPHFVSTLDAFLFRYVLRPFLQKVHPEFAPPRLIPAEWSPGEWSKGPDRCALKYQGVGGKDAPGYSLLDILFTTEDLEGPVPSTRSRYGGNLEPVGEQHRKPLMSAKENIWRRLGWFTHADAAVWASRILADEIYGQAIRREIAQRFPFIVVDELQDTGWFLGKAMLCLLAEQSLRGLLVGDPDQAIFEFNGAKPEIFSKFTDLSGVKVLPLTDSRRCPAVTARIAERLKQSEGRIMPADNAQGSASMLVYADMVRDVRQLADHLATVSQGRVVKVVARANRTLQELIGHAGEAPPKLGCPPLNHLQRAVLKFRQGFQTKALASARAAIDLALFQHEGITEEQLLQQTIKPDTWKALAVRCLLRSNELPTYGSIYEWQTGAGDILENELRTFRSSPGANSIQPKKLGEWRQGASKYLPVKQSCQPGIKGVPAHTVHGVKGETHDTTVLIIPDPKRIDRCPSAVWWSTSSTDQEEKRLAYVAVSRTRDELIVCISEGCLKRLQTERADFVRLFGQQSVRDYLVEKGGANTVALLSTVNDLE